MKLFAFLTLVALASAHFQYDEEFQDWKTKYNKKYDTSNIELERQTIWEANKNYVLNHNANADKFGFILAMNEFADLVSLKHSHYYIILILSLRLAK